MSDKLPTPLQAIRKHCINCAGRLKEIRECATTECSLHRFRMGRNPARKGIGRSMDAPRSIPGRFLPNSTTDSDKTRSEKSLAMSEKVVQPGASCEEIRPIG